MENINLTPLEKYVYKTYKDYMINYEKENKATKSETGNIKMSETNDYNIKMDGDYHEFDGGAIRYTKAGMGRYDLIPMNVFPHILDMCSLVKSN